MPKIKTKSAAKKRFKVTGSGHVKAKPAKMRHMQMNKPKSMKRKARKVMTLDDSNQTMVIDNWMPYAGVKKGKKSPSPAERAAKKAEAAKADAPKKAKASKAKGGK